MAESVAKATGAEGGVRSTLVSLGDTGKARCCSRPASLVLSSVQKETFPTYDTWTHDPKVDLPDIFQWFIPRSCFSYIVMTAVCPFANTSKPTVVFFFLLTFSCLISSWLFKNRFQDKQRYCQCGKGQDFRVGCGDGGRRGAWGSWTDLSSWHTNYSQKMDISGERRLETKPWAWKME